ncbi:MAG: hypothetical protein F6J93_15240 [Oscillatoria sp. SIO1A7]|nr:hypothetical protein [Oscillatoria sp. SIO1A7]
MNLPAQAARKSIDMASASYARYGRYADRPLPSTGSLGGDRALNLQALSLPNEGGAEGDRYVLAACTRFHSFYGKPEFPPEHGFLKLVDKTSLDTVDSLSFSYNQEPASKDAKPDHPSNRCQFVEYIDWGQWQRLRNHYRHKCKPEEFSKTKNNCCTCAKDALQAIGAAAPKNLIEANAGIGTIR